jgi:integrase
MLCHYHRLVREAVYLLSRVLRADSQSPVLGRGATGWAILACVAPHRRISLHHERREHPDPATNLRPYIICNDDALCTPVAGSLEVMLFGSGLCLTFTTSPTVGLPERKKTLKRELQGFLIWREDRDSRKPSPKPCTAHNTGHTEPIVVQLSSTTHCTTHPPGTALANNLIQKSGESTWYVRLAIPTDVQKAFGGRKVLTQSLKTGLRSEAMVRRLQYLAQWKQQIADARAGRALPESWAEDVTDALTAISQGKTLRKMQLIGENVSLPSIIPENEIIALAAMEQTGMLDILGELQDYFGDTLEGQLQFHETLANAFKEMIPDTYAKQFSLSRDQVTEISALVESPNSYKPRSPITQKKLDTFRVWYSSQGNVLKTVDILIRKVEMFSAWLNRRGNTLSFDTVSTYLDGLADAKGKALTSKTKKQHLWACNTYWKWAKKYDAEWRERFKDTQNPFDDHDLPIVKGEVIIYDAFTKYELEMLHAEALAKSDLNLANLIAVAAYTGCRLEEVGHINHSDLTFENGLPIAFNIPDAKTRAGIREVPVHHKLAPLMVELLASSTDGYILPGRALNESNKYNHRLDAVGKRFGRMKKANNFGPLHVFHSVRKTAITIVHQADARMEVMAALFGHETGLITLDIYSSGPSLDQKRKVIELLDYDFNLSQNR